MFKSIINSMRTAVKAIVVSFILFILAICGSCTMFKLKADRLEASLNQTQFEIYELKHKLDNQAQKTALDIDKATFKDRMMIESLKLKLDSASQQVSSLTHQRDNAIKRSLEVDKEIANAVKTAVKAKEDELALTYIAKESRLKSSYDIALAKIRLDYQKESADNQRNLIIASTKANYYKADLEKLRSSIQYNKNGITMWTDTATAKIDFSAYTPREWDYKRNSRF